MGVNAWHFHNRFGQNFRQMIKQESNQTLVRGIVKEDQVVDMVGSTTQASQSLGEMHHEWRCTSNVHWNLTTDARDKLRAIGAQYIVYNLRVQCPHCGGGGRGGSRRNGG